MPSALKEQFVKDLSEEIKQSPYLLLTHYQGLNAEELNDLRAKLKEAGAKFKVVKNRLAKIALKNAGWDMDEHLTGPSALTYKGEDGAHITKVLYDFSKKNKSLKLNAGVLFGEKADQKAIHSIANLPSKEVLLATLLATMNSPLQKLAATLSEPLRALHASLSAVAKKKESAPAA